MSCRMIMLVFLLHALLVAQAPELPAALVQVGSTTARGGDCKGILLSRDARRMLTIGETGDLLWWDLSERRLLQRVASRGKYVTAIALHPTEPWAVVGTTPTGDWNGSVWRCDLDTGAMTELWPGYARAAGFTAAGDCLRVAWLVNGRRSGEVVYRAQSLRGSGPFEEVAGVLPEVSLPELGKPYADSADGKHRARCVEAELRCSGTIRRTIRLDNVDTWLDNVAIADDGTVVAADLQGQMHVVGVDGRTSVLAGHAGDAHRLVFSPDGRFLAVVGLGATRVVDLAGNDIAEWSGTRIVLPGPEGADFWILDRRELRRWSAASRRDVGQPRRWTDPAACLARGGSIARVVGDDDGPADPLFTIGVATIVDGEPWLGTDRWNHMRSWRFRDGAFVVAGREHDRVGPVALVPLRDGRMLRVAGRPGGSLANPRAYLDLLDRAGERIAKWDAEGFPRWVAAADPGGSVCVCLDWNRVVALDPDSLTETATREFVGEPTAAVPFGTNRLLTAIGAELLVIDGSSLATIGSLPRAVDFDRIDCIAVSPSGTHIAVARRSEVRILRVE